MACSLLHNLIRRFMPTDMVLDEVSEFEDESDEETDYEHEAEFITVIETCNCWSDFRNTLPQDMFNNWRGRSTVL